MVEKLSWADCQDPILLVPREVGRLQSLATNLALNGHTMQEISVDLARTGFPPGLESISLPRGRSYQPR